MKTSLTIGVLALTVLLSTACGQPTVDGSSEETFKASLERIDEANPDLPNTPSFAATLMVPWIADDLRAEYMADPGNMAHMTAVGSDPAVVKKLVGNFYHQARMKLDGMTGEELVALYQEMDAEQKAQEEKDRRFKAWTNGELSDREYLGQHMSDEEWDELQKMTADN